MKLLELFSGTKSVSKVFEKHEWETLSLDNDEKSNPDICIDILEWEYKKYPVGHFDYIHASPPCISYSNLGRGKHRKMHDLAPLTDTAIIGDMLLSKTLEIIEYFKPAYYLIENPRGLMRYVIPHIPYTTINYCRYGSPFFKPTDLFNNFGYVGYKCKYERKGMKVDCHHIRMAGPHSTANKKRKGAGIQRTSQAERYRIPEKLTEDILQFLLFLGIYY